MGDRSGNPCAASHFVLLHFFAFLLFGLDIVSTGGHELGGGSGEIDEVKLGWVRVEAPFFFCLRE